MSADETHHERCRKTSLVWKAKKPSATFDEPPSANSTPNGSFLCSSPHFCSVGVRPLPRLLPAISTRYHQISTATTHSRRSRHQTQAWSSRHAPEKPGLQKAFRNCTSKAAAGAESAKLLLIAIISPRLYFVSPGVIFDSSSIILYCSNH